MCDSHITAHDIVQKALHNTTNRSGSWCALHGNFPHLFSVHLIGSCTTSQCAQALPKTAYIANVRRPMCVRHACCLLLQQNRLIRSTHQRAQALTDIKPEMNHIPSRRKEKTNPLHCRPNYSTLPHAAVPRVQGVAMP